MKNQFNKLKDWDGFKNLKFLKDGSCRFERQFLFRKIKGTINPEFEITEFNVSLNWLPAFIFLFGAGPIAIIFIIVTGLQTKENVIHEIKEILSNNRKKGGFLAEIGRRMGWRDD